jgi:signal transduction histidine kinase
MPASTPSDTSRGTAEALRGLLQRRHASRRTQERDANEPARWPAWSSLGTVVAVLVAGVTVAGSLTYMQGAALVERSVQQRLEAVATLKSSLAQAWVEHTRTELRTWAGSAEFGEAMQLRAAGAPLSPQARSHLQDSLWRLAKVENYLAAAVRDPLTGERWLATTVAPDSDSARRRAIEVAANATETSPPAIDPIRPDAPEGQMQLAFFDVVAPAGSQRAVIEADIGPDDDLFKLVREQPDATDTDEVLLVRRTVDSIVVLNDSVIAAHGHASRVLDAAAAGSMWSAIDKAPAGGFVHGTDDRGHDVLAVALPVVGTPWLLVAKLDESEAFGELRRTSALTLAMAVALIGFGTWWWLQHRRHVATASRLQRDRTEQAERLAELSRRVVSTQEEERHRLAAELHDRTCANLVAMQLNLKSVARTVPAQGTEEQELLQETNDLMADTIVSIRTFCTELRPAMLDYAGLVDAVNASAEQFERRTGIRVEIDVHGYDIRCGRELESGLFRIVQEALLNCAKHSRATLVRVRLSARDGRIALEVEDDGAGFDTQAVGQGGRHAGHGLLNMRDRAAFAGGTLSIDSHPGRGTRVRFDMPWGAAPA